MFRLIGIVIILIAILAIFGFDVRTAWEDIIRPIFSFLWNAVETIIFFVVNFFVGLVETIF